MIVLQQDHQKLQRHRVVGHLYAGVNLSMITYLAVEYFSRSDNNVGEMIAMGLAEAMFYVLVVRLIVGIELAKPHYVRSFRNVILMRGLMTFVVAVVILVNRSLALETTREIVVNVLWMLFDASAILVTIPFELWIIAGVQRYVDCEVAMGRSPPTSIAEL